MNDAIYGLQRLVLESISQSRPAQEVLDRLCTLVEAIVPGGFATVMRLDRERNVLTFTNAPCVPHNVLDDFGQLVPGPLAGSCGAAVHEGRMVLVADTLVDPRWQGLRNVATDHTILSCWSVPIFIEKDIIGGTFAISRGVKGLPSDDEARLLEIAAYLAGIVLRFERDREVANEQRALFEAVVEGSRDAIFVKDRDGRYLLVNSAAARHRGLTPDDIVGRVDAELFTETERVRSGETDTRLLEDEESIVYEHQFTSKVDGRSRTYLIRKDPRRDAAGRVTGIVGIARDVTELRRVERALQQTQKLESLGVLAGGIAHDFNNLVTGILANVAWIEDLGVADRAVAEGLADIRASARRAAELTNQLLDYAGKREPARQAVDLRALVGELGQLLQSTLSKKARLRLDFAPGLPVIEADPVRIRQVVMNLLINASEALEGRAGNITVGGRLLRDYAPSPRGADAITGQRGDWLELSVEDTGAGMAPGTLARIFDPFFTTKFTGRGLGLASVHGIVKAHGGFIDVDSQEGRGTIFRVYLPAREAVAEAAVGEASDTPRHQAGRILVIDDEGVVRRVLARILEHSGFEVISACDGEEGLTLLDQHLEHRPLSAIVLDLTMPGLDGRQVAHRIRGAGHHIPIVLTSGLAERDARSGLEPASVNAFLRKPFTSDEVVRVVNSAIGRSL